MSYKFEKLEVWQRSLDYAGILYDIADRLPSSEKYNLRSQITRAANSITLNIAEGSTSQTDAEQRRSPSLAIRSLVETVSCIHLIRRRESFDGLDPLREAYRFSETLFAPLQTFRTSLSDKHGIKEETPGHDTDVPF